MRFGKAAAIGLLFVLLAASRASAQVELSIRDGRVTLVATNATVRQILTEWARIGQTRIVNVERIPGGPVSLQLAGVPEPEALDLLLRSVTGYMAVKRAVPASQLSRYDRILVLPTAAVARVPVASSPNPVFQQPFAPPVNQDNDDGPSVAPPRGPLFPSFPSQGQPPPGEGRVEAAPNGAEAPNQQPSITPFPGASSIGTPRPGMVTPPPAQPGQGGQPSPTDN